MRFELMSQSVIESFHNAIRSLPQHTSRRRGCLGPQMVFTTLVNMADPGKRSYARALEAVLDQVASLGDLRHQVPDKHPSRSGFSQARRRMGVDIFYEGFDLVRQTCTYARRQRDGLFHGLRRVSIDGTRLCLPCSDALGEEFGYHTNQCATSGRPMAGLVLLWDSSANQPIDWQLRSAKLEERNASFQLITHLGPDDVLVADRGYPSFAFFQALIAQQTHFVIRLNTTSISVAREVVDFIASDQDDAIVTFAPILKRHRRFPGNESIRLRLVRDRQHGDRVIATNLLDAHVTREELLEVYCYRWNIETAIRELKEWRGLEHMRSTWPDGIRQEVAAIMTYFHLVGEMEAEMRKKVKAHVKAGKMDKMHLQPEHMPTFNRCLMGDMAVNMLVRALNGGDLRKKWAQCIDSLWRERNYKRPNRSNPRKCKLPHGKWRRTGSYKTRY